MASKSQSTIYLETIADAEAAVLEDNAKKATERSVSEELAQDALGHSNAAKASQKAIEQAWLSGDDNADTSEWQRAVADLEKWSRVYAGHKSRADKATPAHTDKAMAERVAEVMRHYFGSLVPVHASFVASEAPAKDAAYPVCVVTQSRATVYDLETGYASTSRDWGGPLELVYYRSQLMASIDAEKVVELARRRGFVLELTQRFNGEGSDVLDNGNIGERYIVKVRHCDPITAPPLEVMPSSRDTPDIAPTWLELLTDRLSEATRGRRESWTRPDASRSIIGGKLEGDAFTATVEQSVTLEPRASKRSEWTESGWADVHRSVTGDVSKAETDVLDALSADELRGSLIPGVGLITDVASVKASKGTNAEHREVWTVRVKCSVAATIEAAQGGTTTADGLDLSGLSAAELAELREVGAL